MKLTTSPLLTDYIYFRALGQKASDALDHARAMLLVKSGGILNPDIMRKILSRRGLALSYRVESYEDKF